MATVPHLIFRQGGCFYGVKAACVREIHWLPELTIVEETPVHVAGVFSLRGEIIPAIDLSIFFGHGAARYNLSDAVIILESGAHITGVIVNEVVDVMELSTESIQSLPEFDRDAQARRHVVEGEARAGDELVMALNIEGLMYALPASGTVRAAGAGFFALASEAEKKVFHGRAKSLADSVKDVGAGRYAAVAVILLNGEYFGVDLDSVREFSEITGLVPVPCAPPHILGSMNLRGNVLTVVDIRAALNMPPASKFVHKKVVVAYSAGLTVGLAVEDAFDVLYISGDEVKPSASVVQFGNGYIKGTIPYDGREIAYIDLGKLLSREDMIVNEEV